MTQRQGDYRSAQPKGFRLAFGIFMVLFYLAVGVVFILNLFGIPHEWISIAFGCILIAYGIFRGYRLYKGI